MAGDERWLAELWPLVRGELPPPPARVVELGCGPAGGFVPRLRAAGYTASGIDPNAPEGDGYERAAFEDADVPGRLDAVVASRSLHHVDEPAAVVDRIACCLAGGGVLVVLEWDWQGFDETTARWCFERLEPGDGDSWAGRLRERWSASGQPWEPFLRGWAEGHGLHGATTVLDALDRRFERRLLARGPYCFAELPGTSAADEQAAIDAGLIRATRIDYAATLR